ncbi:AAA family ATPase [Yoonia sediminilitoris]|uniref:MoxR-like ATPase n=1 Tax=Yoonia sediminilitoris TaxID=1286148 RepID=A0A2T6KSC1_9RHOB|nr:AAA family ATPase [Yoonia sediminilitoris]PUB19425.1 MoxR-like ATPase [Yoonia sediminilitoris]RCW99593.1 MoxR-like ATPase [Yoonia sediminilitoris]
MLQEKSQQSFDQISELRTWLQAGLIGSDTLIQRLLIGVLTGGHVLIEGAPGLAKTRAVKLLAQALHGTFARVQCTPDLLPADLTGTDVFNPETGRFAFAPGPVFHNLVLVDEINRAPPKVQSALLEAMAETQVTSGGKTHPLPTPFFVVATQNSIEHEGTFPLPEAQLDRFLLHVMLEQPDLATERRILDLVESESSGGSTRAPQLDPAAVQQARDDVARVHLSPALRDYIVRLVVATRTAPFDAEVEHAVSPRGSLALAASARARAYLAGRDHALPEDVDALAQDALAHRMALNWAASAKGRTVRAVITDIQTQTEAL